MCLYQVGAVAKLLYTLSILPWLISLYRKGIRTSCPINISGSALAARSRKYFYFCSFA